MKEDILILTLAVASIFAAFAVMASGTDEGDCLTIARGNAAYCEEVFNK